MSVKLLVPVIVIAISGSATAQEPTGPRNPGSACFSVMLESTEAAIEAGLVEFVLSPAVSPAQARNQVWDLRGPIRAESAALWWPAASDSIAAYWLRDEGVLWELRLDPRPEIMRGWAVQVRPAPATADTLVVDAAQERCRETHFLGHREENGDQAG